MAQPMRRYDDARVIIVDYVTDIAREFNDRAPLTSSVSRADNLYRQSGLPISEYCDIMLAARAATKEHLANIKKIENGRKSAMAYWFSVLADRIRRESMNGTGGKEKT